MPGTKRNDSHRNNHQHQFFHTDKGKKSNLPLKPTKRQQDLHEKTFQVKNKFGFEPLQMEHPQRKECNDATIEHLQALENERVEASLRQRLNRFKLENAWGSEDASNRVTPSSQQNLRSELNPLGFQLLDDYLRRSPTLMQLIKHERQQRASCNDVSELEESGSSLSV